MLKVTLKNGNEYELLEDTTVYPSGSPNARSRMEIHMAEDAMTAAEFEAAFMDEAATAKIRLTKTTDEDNTKIVFDTVYQHYCLVASIGKKRVSKTDIATGQVVEELHLVAELEQRTYIEQQLAALKYVIRYGLNVSQTEAYIERLLAEKPEKKKLKPRILKDVRLFFNTMSRAVETMRMAGIGAEIDKAYEGEDMVVTIRIPAQPQE